MSRAAEILAALYGATRLARFDAQGLGAFNASVEGFWRSFWAAALVAPFYAVLLAFRFDTMADTVHPLRFALVETVTYVIAWLAFPVAMISVARWLGRWDAFVGYIVAYNWTAVVQNAIYLPLAMLAVSGAIPEAAGNMLGFVALIYVLVLGWFIARTALGVPGTTAAAIVALDLMLGLLINGFADSRL
jgi:hypothetical protein